MGLVTSSCAGIIQSVRQHAIRILPALVLALLAPAAHALPALGAYNVDPAQVSVSGFSSGAFMAQQLGIAYSSRIMGVGVFAGGIYDCWRTVPPPGCAYPNRPDITRAVANMNTWSGTQIDPVSNLARQKIYVFIGTNDTVVGPNTADQVVKLYQGFTPASNIHYDNTIPATHAFPTNIDGPGIHPCGGNGVTNCTSTEPAPCSNGSTDRSMRPTIQRSAAR